MSSNDECLICMEPREVFSIPCDTCQKRVCMDCDFKIGEQACPFCRTESLQWFFKIVRSTDPRQVEILLKKYFEKETEERLKFYDFRQRFTMLCEEGKSWKELSPLDTEEECYNTVTLLREYIFTIAHYQKDRSHILSFLGVVEEIQENISNSSRLKVNLDQLLDILEDDTEERLELKEDARLKQREQLKALKRKRKLDYSKQRYSKARIGNSMRCRRQLRQC